jgi:hypothetical protein
MRTPPKRCSNRKRWILLERIAQDLKKSYKIDPITTKIVTTAWIGFFRKSIEGGGFQEMSQELYDICKPEQRPEQRL